MPKNSIFNDENQFVDANNLGSVYYVEAITYAAFVESRITNNLMLINNPTLCGQLGVNPQDLIAELHTLIPIREKLSCNVQKKDKKR